MDSPEINADVMIVRENTAYRIVRKLKIEEGQKQNPQKKKKKTHKIHLTNVISVAIVAA